MAEKQEKIKPEGIATFKRNDRAPEFILGTMVISPNVLKKWCEQNKQLMTEYKGEEQIRLTVMSGQYGLNVCVDTWKPNTDTRSATELYQANEPQKTVDITANQPNSSDLPF